MLSGFSEDLLKLLVLSGFSEDLLKLLVLSGFGEEFLLHSLCSVV